MIGTGETIQTTAWHTRPSAGMGRRRRRRPAHPVVYQAPALCVDLLVYQRTRHQRYRFGLVRTHASPERWGLLSTQIRYGETVVEAAERLLEEALGPLARWQRNELELPPDAVGEFLPDPPGADAAHARRRQHSVALVHAIQVNGAIRPGPSVAEFAWFDEDQLPGPEQVGQRQWRTIQHARLSPRLLGW